MTATKTTSATTRYGESNVPAIVEANAGSAMSRVVTRWRASVGSLTARLEIIATTPAKSTMVTGSPASTVARPSATIPVARAIEATAIVASRRRARPGSAVTSTVRSDSHARDVRTPTVGVPSS